MFYCHIGFSHRYLHGLPSFSLDISAEILKKAFLTIYTHSYEFDINRHVTLFCEYQNSDTQTQKSPFLNHDYITIYDKTESNKQMLYLRYEINMMHLTFAKIDVMRKD